MQYTVTATNGGPATSERTNFSSYKADGMPQTPTLSAVGTPNADYQAVASYSLGSHRSTGYDRVEWRTTTAPTRHVAGAEPGGTTGNVGINQKAMETGPATRPASARPGPTTSPSTRTADQGRRRHQRVAHGQLHHLLVEQAGEQRQCDPGLSDPGDVNTTLGPNQTSYTFNGLGYSTTRSITVTPLADRSGDGPTAGPGPARPTLPQPQGRGGLAQRVETGYRPGCESGDCQYIAYRLSNYQGNIVCTINSSDGAFDTKDDGLNGR